MLDKYSVTSLYYYYCTFILQHTIQQSIHPCHLPKFTEVYAPPQIQCDFHQSIIDSWNTYPLESTTPIAVYTDGSQKQKNNQQLSTHIHHPKQFHQQLSSLKEPLNQPHGIIGTS